MDTISIEEKKKWIQGYRSAKKELRARLNTLTAELYENPTMRSDIVREFWVDEVRNWLDEA